jgi:hypothetical protein
MKQVAVQSGRIVECSLQRLFQPLGLMFPLCLPLGVTPGVARHLFCPLRKGQGQP